jgi:hypothetical protein
LAQAQVAEPQVPEPQVVEAQVAEPQVVEAAEIMGKGIQKNHLSFYSIVQK